MNIKKQTTAVKAVTGQIKITHTQSVLQSIGYQTGNVMYGVEVFVDDTPKSVQQGIKRCEDLVENALGDKLPEMQKLLNGLAESNSSK